MYIEYENYEPKYVIECCILHSHYLRIDVNVRVKR